MLLLHLILHTAQLATVTTVAMETRGASEEKALNRRLRGEREEIEKRVDRRAVKRGQSVDKRGGEECEENKEEIRDEFTFLPLPFILYLLFICY